MEILNKEQTLARLEEIIFSIRSGKIFIYPTDTIYGLGCDATNKRAVQKIRDIKKRDEKPFSIIVPNKQWIMDNCVISDASRLDFLPGPYTLILRIKKENIVAPNISLGETIGVRIPDNWFSRIIREADIPFVSTSVNFSGEKHMEKLDEVSPAILEQVDYVVYDGEKKGQSSAKINLV